MKTLREYLVESASSDKRQLSENYEFWGQNPITTALYDSIKLCDIDGIKNAIKDGASLNNHPFNFAHPLMWAIACAESEDFDSSTIDVIEELLKLGADPNAVSDHHPDTMVYDPSHSFNWHGENDIHENATDRTALAYVLSCDDQGLPDGMNVVIKLLLKHGANPNGVKNSYPPIFIAAHNGDFDAIDGLIKAGADPGIEFRGKCIENCFNRANLKKWLARS